MRTRRDGSPHQRPGVMYGWWMTSSKAWRSLVAMSTVRKYLRLLPTNNLPPLNVAAANTGMDSYVVAGPANRAGCSLSSCSDPDGLGTYGVSREDEWRSVGSTRHGPGITLPADRVYSMWTVRRQPCHSEPQGHRR